MAARLCLIWIRMARLPVPLAGCIVVLSAHAIPDRAQPAMSPAAESAKSSSPAREEDDLRFVRNRIFEEIAVGDRVSTQRTLNASDVQLFAVISGDDNPQQTDAGMAMLTERSLR